MHRYPYQRIISTSQLKGGTSVVILATIQNPGLGKIGSIVLMEEERHATGSREQGLPRGFGEAGLSGEQNALKELREETGYIGESPSFMGSAYVDSGATNSKTSFYHIKIKGYQPSTAEEEEAIGEVSLLSLDDLWKRVRLGTLRDGFTLQALALFEQYRIYGNSEMVASS